MSIKDKNIVLIVSGGIAAYKACALTSTLTKWGARVHVILTESAQKFVSSTTFHGLSRNPVYDDLFTEQVPHQIAHIDLADQADLVIVAPATANIMAKMASGIADDLATTTLLATTAPVWVAPAMNVNMYDHPTVRENLDKLKTIGYRLLDPEEGTLACGWVGKGRMVEPEVIAEEAAAHFVPRPSSPYLKGKKLLVTAGPTQEKMDPVRYFTNRSSGKMGYAIAEAAAQQGADVTLISGPTALGAPRGVETIYVTSAQEMYQEVIERFEETDVVIKTAAVADYRPKTVSEQKIKKAEGEWTVTFVRNPDILQELGKRKTHQLLVGFAAETEHLQDFAMQKLEKKQLDMIVANNVAAPDAGFSVDTNRVTFIYKGGASKDLELMSKQKVAEALCEELDILLKSRASK
ncbi:putative coenzyme A biosynthesis bifunctional protein CoaBC [Pullulanibacillus camelliae]|uniref:Coenzyme A biosynthesis bifunctional protein CoaBC n=1 Tax=Pullulanibacillus camelliae TaxID=1707096 RepID=A0A8J2W0V0_9BACL|nr:bifunctional phosphopantothenoylcysteine decarboxylase/phosphopantothenate--cysteine ligase CoaBC [Pullulanibacillus camelliae]GGE41760.1 putative coenzyme A biosynthesis bifunctional protein CoaBC [Pullulanibacillus camelliae]